MVICCVLFFFFFPWIETVFSESDEKPCEEDFSVKIESYLPLRNGSVWDIRGATLYHNGTFWTEQEGGKSVVRGCPCLLTRPCLRKCCPMEEVANAEGQCVKEKGRKFFHLNISNDDGALIGTVDAKDRFGVIFGVVSECERKFHLEPESVPGDGYYLRASDGWLVMYERNITFGPYYFCYDFVPNFGDTRPFLCEPPLNIDSTAAAIYPCFLFISAVFLLLTLLVYAIVPELRNLHGIIVMCHNFSLFLAFSFFSAIAFAGRRMPRGMCVASAFIIEFSVIAAFFWLSVMCFDICKTFGGMRPTRVKCRNLKQDLKKFYQYSLFAWGSPTIILVVTVIMQFSPDLPENVIRPDFGKVKCYFHSHESLAAYLYGPITTLLLINIIMFIITSINIYKINKTTKAIMTEGSRRNAAPVFDYNKDRLFLYIKLFIVMGVSWIADFIAWVTDADSYYFYLTDIWNSLQGFFIFIIFVWKKNVRQMVQQKICPTMPNHFANMRKFLRSLAPCPRKSAKRQDETSTPARSAVDSSLLSSNLQENSFRMNDSSRRLTASSSTFMESRPQEGASPTQVAQ